MCIIVSSTDPPLLQIVFSLKTNGFCCQFRIVLHEISKDLNKVNSFRRMEANIHFQITTPMMSEISKKKLEDKAEAILGAPFVAQSQTETMSTKLWKPGGQIQIRQSNSNLFNEL